jgi:hypothetical protein
MSARFCDFPYKLAIETYASGKEVDVRIAFSPFVKLFLQLGHIRNILSPESDFSSVK